MSRRAAAEGKRRMERSADVVERDPAIARGLKIVELVAGSDAPLSLATIGERLGLSKATAHRIVGLLEREGFLQREPDIRRFGPGHRLIGVAVDALCHSSLRGERHAIMRALVEDIGETCNFTMRDGTDVVYIDRVEAAWPLRLHLQPGSRVPLHCTASGKLFLSRMPARQRRRLLAALPLTRYTDNTLVNPRALENALAGIRRAGVATDNEEFLSGLIAVAVPVVDRRGAVLAALAVHAPTARLSLDRAMAHVEALRAAATRLAETL
jgi:DNA-binding IclR family transcriptional regulator